MVIKSCTLNEKLAREMPWTGLLTRQAVDRMD